MSATHVPQQHVDVGARTLTPLVGDTRAFGAASSAGNERGERGDRDESYTSPRSSAAEESTSTSIVAEGGSVETGPSTPSRLTHPHSFEDFSLHSSSLVGPSPSKQSPRVSPPSSRTTHKPRTSPKSKSKAKSSRSPKPSTSTSQSSSPSAPVLVNSPPQMHLPSSLHGVAGGGRSRHSARSSKSHSPASSPDPNAFSFASILDSINSDPNAAHEIDQIARICGRSRLSLANQYGAHRDPVGAGVRVIGEDVSEEDIAAMEASGLGLGFTGLPGGLETVEETPPGSESERMGTNEGSPVIGGPESDDPRWSLYGVWEGRSGTNAGTPATSNPRGTQSRAGVARPTAGLSEVEFRERAELEMGRGGGRDSAAMSHLLRLASVG